MVLKGSDYSCSSTWMRQILVSVSADLTFLAKKENLDIVVAAVVLGCYEM